jgi:Alternative complex III, ActD subunit
MSTQSAATATLYGIMAEFSSAEELLAVARRAREAGYRNLDAYSPFPIHGMDEALALPKTRIPLLVLLGGLAGLALGLGLQYWVSAIDYPIMVGGKPYASWPAFVPVAFELTILLAGLTGGIGMLALNGLPMPYHPVFNVERFTLASNDRFFLCIEATDPKFHREETKTFLEELHPYQISEVEE